VGIAAVDVVAAGEAAVVGVGVCADARPAARTKVMARDRFFMGVLDLGEIESFPIIYMFSERKGNEIGQEGMGLW
jgi:hypothetical protein